MKQPQSTWLGAAILIGILALAAVFGLTPRQWGREARQKRAAQSALQKIGLALYSYHAFWRVFPPATTYDENERPLTSWRALVVPYLENAPSYNTNAAWDAPANRSAGATFFPPYYGRGNAFPNRTSFLAVVGDHTVLRERESLSASEIRSLADVALVVEVHSSAIPWAEPKDLTMDELVGLFQSRSLGRDPEGFHVLFADASVHFIPYDTPVDKLVQMFRADKAAANDPHASSNAKP